MFDRVQAVIAPREINANIQIKEQKAPTDDSVRLLREMENAAKKEVIKSISINDNNFNGVIHVMDDHLSCERIFRVIFSMNGKKIVVNYKHDAFDEKTENIVNSLIDLVAKDIALEILRKPMIDTFAKNKWDFR